MQVLIEAQSLSKEFQTFKAVDELSFSVNRGDVYGFLGQNGAGKSTTIRMMLSLIRPTAGSITIFGHNLLRSSKEVLSRVGAVIERPDLYKYLSAEQQLRMFAAMNGIHLTKAELLQQLARVGLEQRAASRVGSFSQGMKQRLGIAIALVHNPELILLDEPTNGLDPQGIADIRHLILHLSGNLGKTLVISSHLLSEVEQVANRMLIIHRGKKVAEGSVRELLSEEDLLVEVGITDLPDALARLKGSPLAPHMAGERSGKLLFRVTQRELSEFNQALIQLGIAVESIRPRHSLEDFFLQLTTSNDADPTAA